MDAASTAAYAVPHDVLHLMPFATIASQRSNDRQASYLLAQVPSVRSLLRALGTAAAGGPLVAFGSSGGAGNVAEMRAVRRAAGRKAMPLGAYPEASRPPSLTNSWGLGYLPLIA